MAENHEGRFFQQQRKKAPWNIKVHHDGFCTIVIYYPKWLSNSQQILIGQRLVHIVSSI